MHIIQLQPDERKLLTPLIAIIEAESEIRDERIHKLKYKYTCGVEKYESLGHFVNESQIHGVSDFDLILITYDEKGYPSTNIMRYLKEFGQDIFSNSYVVGRVQNCKESEAFMKAGIDWIVKVPMDENDYRTISQGAYDIRNAKLNEEFGIVSSIR